MCQAWDGGMEPAFRLMGALSFVENAARDRIARYRAQASNFRELADREPVGRLRTELLKLAQRYESLAETITARSRDGS